MKFSLRVMINMLLAIFVWLFLSTCGGGDGGEGDVISPEIPEIIETTSQTITPAQGGTVTLPENGSRVLMPPGMFATDQVVTLSLLSLLPSVQDVYTETTAIFNAGPAASQVVVVDTS